MVSRSTVTAGTGRRICYTPLSSYVSESSGSTVVHHDSNVFHRYRSAVHAIDRKRRHDDRRPGNGRQIDIRRSVRLQKAVILVQFFGSLAVN